MGITRISDTKGEDVLGELSKSVALITGSTSGIGRSIAMRLSSEGYRVVINSSRSIAEGRALAESLPEAIYYRADVSDCQDSAGLVQETVDQWGRLDIVVNNVGITRRIPHANLDAVDADFFLEVLKTNVVGPWNIVRAAYPHLRKQRNAVVINISSVAGVRPRGSSIPYATSKAALNHLTQLLARALAPEIRVNAVAPGLIKTPRTADWYDRFEEAESVTPLARAGLPEEVAEACVGVIAATYMTGEVLVVDGGLHLN